jgi:hypothetical protein
MSQLHYQQLNNESLDSVEFERLALKLKEEMTGSFPSRTVPWNAEGVLQGLANTVSSIRTQRSSGWINALEESLAGLERMDVSDANRLHGRATTPPSYLTEKDAARRSTCVQNIETRLNALKVDWLVEKFGELSDDAQRLFVKRILGE